MGYEMSVIVHGLTPCPVAAIHGGPGAPGSACHLAELIHAELGIAVLEPYQSATDIAGLTAELDSQLRMHCALPAVLIGHSWGAWLAALYAERHPENVRQLILVGSGPLSADYVPELERRREARLSPEERRRFHALLEKLERSGGGADQDALLKELGALCHQADFYAPLALPAAPHTPAPDGAAYEAIWREAAGLRRSGALLEVFRRLAITPVFIHGDSDPHPPEGIRAVLEASGIAFGFHLLKRCGHEPWAERYARAEFARLLKTLILPTP
ncbi:hypothetical protein SDC9_102458 [bioreactor metagenome]|uniref:AB hydrolase-1 domain-containing protein n=1 Tax=bioreactor metagenome TaxID=1076179 RepID=A0A645ATM1_9ZZZZ